MVRRALFFVAAFILMHNHALFFFMFYFASWGFHIGVLSPDDLFFFSFKVGWQSGTIGLDFFKLIGGHPNSLGLVDVRDRYVVTARVRVQTTVAPSLHRH